ncbi:uncharacterized protein LOC144464171 [Epinephelus lanceolatus]
MSCKGLDCPGSGASQPDSSAAGSPLEAEPPLGHSRTLIHRTATVILEYKMDMVHKNQYPPWKRLLEAKIKATQREVSQLTKLHRSNMVNKGAPRKYNKLSIPEALETAKQRLTALATRLKRYTKEVEARRINRLFSSEPAKVFSQWQGNNSRSDPLRAELETYWKGIWERAASHNTCARWLVDLRADHSNLPEQEPVTISMADIQERVSKMESWTAPSPDMIHIYWLKEIPSENRPITCLSTAWKFLSGIIAAKITRHMGQYMSKAQKGIGSNTRGAKHQLLIDRAIARDCRSRKINLCTAWTDYKKAYDSMPHTWILECLELYKINSHHKELYGNVEDHSRGKLKVDCPSQHQMRHIPRGCTVTTAVLHT